MSAKIESLQSPTPQVEKQSVLASPISIRGDWQRALENSLNLEPGSLSNENTLQEVSQIDWVRNLLASGNRKFWADMNPRLRLANEERSKQTHERISSFFHLVTSIAVKIGTIIPSLPSVPDGQEYNPLQGVNNRTRH